jgi:hypothetical protein
LALVDAVDSGFLWTGKWVVVDQICSVVSCAHIHEVMLLCFEVSHHRVDG